MARAEALPCLDLKEKDWKQKDIAEALGVTEGAVSQWLKRAREGGREALKTAEKLSRPLRALAGHRNSPSANAPKSFRAFWRKEPSTSAFAGRCGRAGVFAKLSRRGSVPGTRPARLDASSTRSVGARRSRSAGLPDATTKRSRTGNWTSGRASKKSQSRQENGDVC